MKAELQPLSGKYYGTDISVTDGEFEYNFSLWNCGNYEPSDRELSGNCTIDEWRANKDLYEICDTHFESRETHALAEKIVRLINESKDIL